MRAREAPSIAGSIAGVLNNLGRCHDNMCQYARMRPLFEQARAAAAAAGDTKEVGQVCENHGACHYNMGQHARALPLFEQARAAFAAAGDSAGAARVSGYLADCAARAGRR